MEELQLHLSASSSRFRKSCSQTRCSSRLGDPNTASAWSQSCRRAHGRGLPIVKNIWKAETTHWLWCVDQMNLMAKYILKYYRRACPPDSPTKSEHNAAERWLAMVSWYRGSAGCQRIWQEANVSPSTVGGFRMRWNLFAWTYAPQTAHYPYPPKILLIQGKFVSESQ